MKSVTGPRLRILAMALALCLVVDLLPGLSDLLRAFEQRLYDLRVRQAAMWAAPSDEVVIIGIDDRSLDTFESTLGRWPWPRHVYADLIRQCFQARVIAMDIIFPEADRSDLSSDERFVRAVAEHGGVVSSVHFDNQPRRPMIPAGFEEFALSGSPPPSMRLVTALSVLSPIPDLLVASAKIGHVNYVTDSDGVLRTHALLMQAEDRMYPSLSLAAAMLARGVNDAVLEGGRLHWGDESVDLDDRGHFQFFPTIRPPRVYSIEDVLSQSGADPIVPPSMFKEKVVLVGSMATGLPADRQVTPLGPYVPGVLNNAVAVENLLTGRIIRRPPSFWRYALLLLLCVVPVVVRFRSPGAVFLLSVLGLLVYGSVSSLMMHHWQVMIPATLPLMGMIASCIAVAGSNWRQERCRREELEKLEAAKQGFTDMLVHDLRNDVQPILLSLELIENYGMDSSLDMDRITEGARMGATRLLSQINALLDIRKMQEGRMQLDPSWVRCDDLYAAIVQQYGSAAELANIELEIASAPESAGAFQADPEIMARVLGNLVWNAVQHAEKKSRIELGWQTDDSEVRLYVSNHGRVIPPELQARLFTPFVTGRADLKQVGRVSTGLGLAFSKLAIEAHGGTIELESPWPGHDDGVQVRIRVPLERTSA